MKKICDFCNTYSAEYRFNGKVYCDECILKVMEVKEEKKVITYYYDSDGAYLGTDEEFSEVIEELGVEYL